MKEKKYLLSQYSALAAGFLALCETTDAQVIYTDIIPDDTVLNDVAGGLAYIDMDNNGTIDFAFLNNTFTFYYLPYESTRYYERIWAGPAIMQNSIAGIKETFYGTDSYILYFPFALSFGALIDSEIDFQNWGFQRMAYRTFSYSIILSEPTTTSGGFWFPEKLDNYLGVNFKDDSDSSHFGWIRCSVLDSGRTLILYDYAYEIKAEYPIIAGDTMSYVSIENTFENNVFTILTGNILSVHLPEQQENTSIELYSLQGSLCFSKNDIS